MLALLCVEVATVGKKQVAAVVFEGGNPVSPIERDMTSVRKAVALDNLEKVLAVPDIDPVILSTNYRDLAERARAKGVRINQTPDDGSFHFGEHLKWVVDAYGLSRVIYFGGAALPLIRKEDFAKIAWQLGEMERVVIVNNAQSADLIAFTPTDILSQLPPVETDNFLGYMLREAGLSRIMIENSARINFDLDTPVDMVIMDQCRRLGPKTRQALDGLKLPSHRLKRAMEVLFRQSDPYPEVALIGRVGPAMMSVINANLPVRLRVFSEERGMKSLQREARGEAISWLGFYLEAVGPVRFFSDLAQTADVAFIDTRVLFAHFDLNPSPADRYYSDLGRVDEIGDPFIRQFTAAANAAEIPVMLGGHSLVYGGLWALLEEYNMIKHGVPALPTS